MTQLTLIVSAAHRAILVVSVYVVPSANVFVLVELLPLSTAHTSLRFATLAAMRQHENEGQSCLG